LSSTIKPDVYLKKLTIVITKNPLLDEHKQHWTIIIKKHMENWLKLASHYMNSFTEIDVIFKREKLRHTYPRCCECS